MRHLTVLHGIFKRAKREVGPADNPAWPIWSSARRSSTRASSTPSTATRSNCSPPPPRTPQDAAIYKAAAFTGLRQGELLALRWSDVDFVGGLLHVRRNFTGGERSAEGQAGPSVPMMPAVIDTLAALKEREHFAADGDLVFCSEVGEHLDHFELRKRFYAALEKAGLRRIRFHDLRHAFGSAAIKKLDPYAVQSYMGHPHYSTTQRYLHHQPRREDAAALAEAFGGAVGGTCRDAC